MFADLCPANNNNDRMRAARRSARRTLRVIPQAVTTVGRTSERLLQVVAMPSGCIGRLVSVCLSRKTEDAVVQIAGILL